MQIKSAEYCAVMQQEHNKLLSSGHKDIRCRMAAD